MVLDMQFENKETFIFPLYIKFMHIAWSLQIMHTCYWLL